MKDGDDGKGKKILWSGYTFVVATRAGFVVLRAWRCTEQWHGIGVERDLAQTVPVAVVKGVVLGARERECVCAFAWELTKKWIWRAANRWTGLSDGVEARRGEGRRWMTASSISSSWLRCMCRCSCVYFEK